MSQAYGSEVDQKDYLQRDQQSYIQEEHILQLKRIIESTNFTLDQLYQLLYKNKEEQIQLQSVIQEIINKHQITLKEKNQNQQIMSGIRQQYHDSYADQDYIINMIGKLQKEQLQYESYLLKFKEEEIQLFSGGIQKQEIQNRLGEFYRSLEYFKFNQLYLEEKTQTIQESKQFNQQYLYFQNLIQYKEQIQMDTQQLRKEIQVIQSIEDDTIFQLEKKQQKQQEMKSMEELILYKTNYETFVITQRDKVFKKSEIDQKQMKLSYLAELIKTLPQQQTLDETFNTNALIEKEFKMPSDYISELIKSNRAKIDNYQFKLALIQINTKKTNKTIQEYQRILNNQNRELERNQQTLINIYQQLNNIQSNNDELYNGCQAIHNIQQTLSQTLEEQENILNINFMEFQKQRDNELLNTEYQEEFHLCINYNQMQENQIELRRNQILKQSH
ncbi:hypothetical protein pb186bvf_002256 [Paramecium bursaria]